MSPPPCSTRDGRCWTGSEAGHCADCAAGRRPEPPLTPRDRFEARRRLDRRSAPAECVAAWEVAEGDVLPGGEKVVSVQRDPAADRVSVGTDDGARLTLRRDDRIVVVSRALIGRAVPGGRVATFVDGVRQARLRRATGAA